MTLPSVSGAPDLDTIRAWVDVPRSMISDEQLAGVRDAEIAVQAAYCRFPPGDGWPGALRQALLRRCARAVAARGIPLGSFPAQYTGTGTAGYEYGVNTLPRLDAEIERYEDPFRIVAVA